MWAVVGVSLVSSGGKMVSGAPIGRKALAALRKLLRQSDPLEVRHGLMLMEAMEDTELGVEVDPVV